jgi:dihydroorotate dehydrogenase
MSLYTRCMRPLLFALDPETAHYATLRTLRIALGTSPVRWMVRSCHRRRWSQLDQQICGLSFPNPVGLAAGLDKNAQAIEPFAALGFSHVEVGTVTGQAQPGNPKPRCFRLPDDHGLINRMGFNNDGAAAVAARLAAQYRKRRPGCVLGINVGKSKIVDLASALSDYEISVRALAPLADYLVVNVSSPNTPGLRDLQSESQLRPLLAGVRKCVDEVMEGEAGGGKLEAGGGKQEAGGESKDGGAQQRGRKPLFLKIAPDLSEAGLDAAVDVALETGCDGLIATNTTIAREGLTTPAERVALIGSGGLSGAPVRERADAVLAHVSRRIAGRVPVIGVGGIDSAEAAWRKIGLGASLLQIYTGLIYEGPGLVGAINRGLAARLEEHGLRHIREAVGRDL